MEGVYFLTNHILWFSSLVSFDAKLTTNPHMTQIRSVTKYVTTRVTAFVTECNSTPSHKQMSLW